jgi:RHS repeat-associated protein
VNDPETGLTYMQQRYYDPMAGRFMSVDPVLTDGNTGASFNRYVYANNSPYKYIDPDGRVAFLVPVAIFLVKEAAAEVASHYTGGASDFLSVRRSAQNVGGFALTKIAPAAADAAKSTASASKSGLKGASGDLTTASGKTYHGNSTGSSASGGDARAPMHPETQQSLDGVQNPSRSHGHCCEIDAINKALNAGDDVKGAKMGPVKLNESGRILPACSTCAAVKKDLGVE